MSLWPYNGWLVVDDGEALFASHSLKIVKAFVKHFTFARGWRVVRMKRTW